MWPPAAAQWALSSPSPMVCVPEGFLRNGGSWCPEPSEAAGAQSPPHGELFTGILHPMQSRIHAPECEELLVRP